MSQEAQNIERKNEKDITAYDIESYISQRWNSQRNYFSKSSQKKQKYFNFCQILIIVLSALSVTVLTIDLDSLGAPKWCSNKIVCAILSLAVIVVSGIDKLKQYNAEWVKDRNTTEKLKSEICKYKFGVEPYIVPIKPEEKTSELKQPEAPAAEKPKADAVSDRTKLLLEKLNALSEKCEDVGVRNSYKEIKNEVANYVAGTNDYAPIKGEISKKDKTFVERINTIMDEYIQLFETQNIYSRIKNEICDFYTDKGAYKVEEKSKPKPEPKLIISKNDRLFVERVEDIISKDVDNFVATKSKLSNIDAQIDQLIQSKSGSGKK